MLFIILELKKRQKRKLLFFLKVNCDFLILNTYIFFYLLHIL